MAGSNRGVWGYPGMTWPKCAHWAAMTSGTVGKSTMSMVPRKIPYRLARMGLIDTKGTLRSSDLLTPCFNCHLCTEIC